MVPETEYAETVAFYAAALRMVREAIEELFGSMANLENEEAVLLGGPEPQHRAEAMIVALHYVSHHRHDFANVWRNVKSAPKDGRTFFIGIGDRVISDYCNKDGDFCSALDGGPIQTDRETLWHPYPSSPQRREESAR
ncbi:hypothetical protein SAMN04488498_12751 [Mesorhizobium albiziae]|uniref:Uncharacterized protein n=1 Tax=Neomesorhizobium albiziae TaxID=335020 RepID=A0A1I4ELN3_9HYPH|nr:hypothetical protein [Mesorhizobium albiziae]GLS34405.1 hypothetical protein GCM10007937_61200 [Mesorhizobium albiziae]SFL06199.1 hypothetical protein SAMN04488498_12751 [Mesorhizobium albiziae]